MIWEITYLLAIFSVSITAPRADYPDPDYPAESSSSNEIPKEYLERLCYKEVLPKLIVIPTLDSTEFVFDNNDVKLLTTECNVDEECLSNKSESVKKYHRKMQAIQCVNGLYVLKVLAELKSIIVNMKNNTTSISSLQKPIKEYQFYLSSMLTLLNLAHWDAYAWQIELFTFLSGLAASEVIIEPYVEHYEKHNLFMQLKVLAFVNQCLQHDYLLSLNNTATEVSAVFQFVETIYKNNEMLMFPRLFYTVPNLMLRHLYLYDDFIFDWSMFEIELDTSNVNRQMRTQLGFYCPENLIDEWILDPIGGNKYNVLVTNHIHLKAEYLAWFHLYVYRTLLSRLLDETMLNTSFKERLINIWITLASDLKCILRAVGFDENIYWSAINIMMIDFINISKGDLQKREEFTRNFFCQSVEDLGLASASDMNRQLQKLEIPNDFFLMYRGIQANVTRTAQYCLKIVHLSYLFKDRFIRILVAAEENETFVKR